MQLSFLPHQGEINSQCPPLLHARSSATKLCFFQTLSICWLGVPEGKKSVSQEVSEHAHFEQLLFWKQNRDSYPGTAPIPQTLSPCHHPLAPALGSCRSRGQVPHGAQPPHSPTLHLPSTAPHGPTTPMDGWNCRAWLGAAAVPAAGGHQAAGLIFSSLSIWKF